MRAERALLCACGRFARRSRSLTSQMRLVRADEASIPRWFEVAGGEFGSTPVLEPGRAGTPVLHRVFLMADRSAEQRAELRSAGQPTAAVPTWFFFQIGMRAGSAQYPSHTGNVLQAVHARLKP